MSRNKFLALTAGVVDRTHNGPNYGVEPGTIASTSEHSRLHCQLSLVFSNGTLRANSATGIDGTLPTRIPAIAQKLPTTTFHRHPQKCDTAAPATHRGNEPDLQSYG